jgi:putative PLP-dependent aminotransferase (TIGR04422 family)
MKHRHVRVWYQKPIRLSRPTLSDYKSVETFFSANFEGGYPVLVSSARAAIAILLGLFWTTKTIKIFKYASQCVVKACTLSGISPVSSLRQEEDIVYHQWGYPVDRNTKEVFIEDACDSFKRLGSKVLTLESRFEIWSLSKILGLRFGAIIWCKDKQDAQEIFKIRNSKPTSFLKITLNLLKKFNVTIYNQWENLELTNCSLSKFQIGAIHKEVLGWENLFNFRQDRLNLKISVIKQLGYTGGFEMQDDLLKRTILPTVLIGNQELENFTDNTLLRHRINVKNAPYPVRIYPAWYSL